ncbi:hypothetical protein PsorP6_013076 [Peronosclerospora sorghi]|uniref:Uncharacterized protein n=1 Tax=Peronosclerospora sorghi TaxID=230839 RepID=A0ACC0WEU5_9STRA|nr:hypothetical protein PsorP6_013076 [Peronosclerospora sorghi]
MDRHEVSRQRKKANAMAHAKERATKQSSENQENMLSRLLVRLSVIAVIVALSALTLAMQQQNVSNPIPSHASNTMEQAKSEVDDDRRPETGTRPMVEVLAKYPHDPAAFTQGLLMIHDGDEKFLIESTGLYGRSSLRYVDIESGNVLKQYNFPEKFFGEGVTLGPKNDLVMLTWKSKTGFIFKVDKTMDGKVKGFASKSEFAFETVTGEGWGITYDGEDLIVSDGSSSLIFWDPLTMKEKRRVDVKSNAGKQSTARINELEHANGFIYANVWYQPYILKIDPKTGAVITSYDLSELIVDVGADMSAGAVLNGIAYDSAEDVFYVTGKLWHSVYKGLEISAVPSMGDTSITEVPLHTTSPTFRVLSVIRYSSFGSRRNSTLSSSTKFTS